MITKDQIDFIKKVKSLTPKNFKKSRVLEMGCSNTEGIVRSFFEDPTEYIRIDTMPNNSVDIVCLPSEYSGVMNTSDAAISIEFFQNDSNWKETFINMINHVNIGGLVLITCNGKKESDFDGLINKNFNDFKFEYNEESDNLFFYGKRSVEPLYFDKEKGDTI